MKQFPDEKTTSKMNGLNEPRYGACTLFEGQFHLGAAALINSLYKNGYRGVFYAGYRGELPPWAQGKAELSVAEGLTVKFLKLETKLHFTFCKAMLMERLFDEVSPELDVVLYFDADIFLKCPWSYFLSWTDDRVALCEDVNWNFPTSHPVRREWDQFLNPLGYFPKHEQNFYYNAGFVGVARSQRKFLRTWEEIMQAVGPLVGDRFEISYSDPNFFFHKADQDSMNIAADIYPEVISAMGPEAMDFTVGGHTMSHAVGPYKPWRREFLRHAFGGLPPSMADKEFFENAERPIQIFSPVEFAWRRLKLKLAAAITRFVRRN